MNDPGRVLILGAGPTGLAAAYRLQELGHQDFLVLEAREDPGGLAASYVDAQGFTWDVGGHVQFSHYAYYDKLLDKALGEDWLYHERESWIWIKGRFVPYPFQNNLRHLDKADQCWCVAKLEQAAGEADRATRSANFKEWIMRTFGEGISHLFLYPYNTKVWGYPLESLDVNWMIDRVAVPDVERVKRNILEGKDDVTWGPNNKFRYPLKGGTGAIWRGVANLLQPAHLRFRHVVESVDLLARKVRCQNGETFQWDTLITSIPLDRLCGISEGLGAAALSASRALVHSSIHIVGVGVRGPRPAALDRKCWMYFPEDHSPYYRITIFSNYSPFNVPRGQGYWSLMAEVCESPYRPVDLSALRESVLRAMREDCLIPGAAEVVSFWQRREEYGYPTPFLGRDATLALILPDLERWQVYSRGRFGAWKYEVSNQDHSAMQGVQVVNRLLLGEPEVTLTTKP